MKTADLITESERLLKGWQQICETMAIYGNGWPKTLPRDWWGLYAAARLFTKDLPPTISAEVREIYSALRAILLSWRPVGCPTYELSASAAAGLLLTDAGRIPVDDVKWPYESFAITLPTPSPISFYSDDGSREMGVTHLLVMHTSDTRTVQDGLYLRDLTASQWRAAFANDKKQPLPSLTPVSAESRGLVTEPGILVNVLTEQSSWLVRIPHLPGTRLKDWVSGVDAEARKVPNFPHFEAVHRLICNLMLYLVSRKENAIEVPYKERHNGQQRLYSVDLRDPSTGCVIKLPPEVRNAARAWADKEKNPARYKLSTQIVVPGHYRHYYVGPRDPEKRNNEPRKKIRKWIFPYSYGDTAAEAMVKTYQIDEVPDGRD